MLKKKHIHVNSSYHSNKNVFNLREKYFFNLKNTILCRSHDLEIGTIIYNVSWLSGVQFGNFHLLFVLYG